MTDAQIFQMMGIAYVAIGFGALVDSTYLTKLVADLKKNYLALFVGGMTAFVVGFIIVVFHNVWKATPSLVITIFGWIALIKGLLILVSPSISINLFEKIDIKKYQKALGLFCFVLGTLLVYIAFMG